MIVLSTGGGGKSARRGAGFPAGKQCCVYGAGSETGGCLRIVIIPFPLPGDERFDGTCQEIGGRVTVHILA